MAQDMMFTTKNFKDLTKGLSEMEVGAIKKGVLYNGMSKRAVLICYGPPPEHYTPRQDSNIWYYWRNRRDKITLTFDPDNLLVSGGIKSIPVNNNEQDLEAKLKKLRDLRDKNLISNEEYARKKAKLLEEL